MKLKKSDWYTKRHSGEIKDDEQVKLWSLPHGCRCNISGWDGSVILKNGETSAVNVSLAKALYDAGIEGDVLINSTNSLPQTVSRWLTWWLSNKPSINDRAFNTLRVAVFDKMPTADLPFEVEVLKPYTVNASEVLDILAAKSPDLGLSLIGVERENGDYFELEPIRYTAGIILAKTDYGYVVEPTEIGTKTPIIVNRVSRSTRAMMELNGVSEDTLVGARVKLQYTMYTAGDRISNYKGAVIYSVDGLHWGNAADIHEITDQHRSGYVYKGSLTGGRPGLLTPARCGRAKISVVGKTNGTVIEAVESENNSGLFTFEPNAAAGQFAVLLSRHGMQSIWRFDSRYNIDVLAPCTLTKHIDDRLYHATGYSIDELGILYRDSDDDWCLGGVKLPRDVTFATGVIEECEIA